MSIQRDILTDVESGVYRDDYHACSDNQPGAANAAPWSVSKRTLRGGLSDGVDVVTVDNGSLQFDLLPTRGLGLWRGQCQGVPLGWRSPVRFPVHPAHVNLASCGGFGWLQGFNEWMCRCGLDSFGNPATDRGTGDGQQQLTLHGRIANLPAHHVSVEITRGDSDRLAVRGIVDETALFGPKLRLDSRVHTEAGLHALEIVDESTNTSDEPGELQLLYHTNFGAPLLEAGSQIVAAVSEVAPYDEHSAASIERWQHCEGPTPGFVEQCYFLRPIADDQGVASIMVRNSSGERAVLLSFNIHELRCLTIWKLAVGMNDGYVLGLEPGTSYPNPKPFERDQGRVIQLAPGETYRTSLRIEFLGDAREVARQEAAIRQQQEGCSPLLHPAHHPEFSSIVK